MLTLGKERMDWKSSYVHRWENKLESRFCDAECESVVTCVVGMSKISRDMYLILLLKLFSEGFVCTRLWALGIRNLGSSLGHWRNTLNIRT